MASGVCPECDGLRLRTEALHVFIEGKNIAEVSKLSISDAFDFFKSIKLEKNEAEIAKQILKEIKLELVIKWRCHAAFYEIRSRLPAARKSRITP